MGGIIMINVVATNYVKDGCLDEFLIVVKELVEETLKYDTGCINYGAYRDLSNPLTVTVFEEWENQAAIDNHLSSKHFIDTVTKITPYCAKATEARQFEKLF